MTKLFSKILMAGAAVAMTAAAANAATTTNTFQAKITIQADCEVTSPPDLDFGTKGLLNNNVDQTSTFNVKCTQGTDYDVGLDAGTTSGGSTTTRKMTDGSGNTVDYKMFSDSGRTTNWGDTVNTDTVNATGSGSDQAYTIYGRVPPQATPPVGNYTDTVTITVTY